MRLLYAALAAATLFCASARADDPARSAARVEIKRAFIAGTEGPDPATLPDELKVLASELRRLRAGSTLDRVTAFSTALDPVLHPMPPDEIVSFYIRSPKKEAGADPRIEALRAAQLRERVRRAMANASLAQAGVSLPDEPAAPYRTPAPAPPPPTWIRSLPLAAAPIFSSAERGSVAPPVNAVARTYLERIEARVEDYAVRRDAAWASGHRLQAAVLAAVGAAGHVMKASWSLVSAMTGKDSAKNVANAVLYQPAALLDYGTRQAALPDPKQAPGAYASGAALNLTFLVIEAMPGSRLAKDEVRWAYKGLVHDSHDALHRLEAAEKDLGEALRRAESAPAGSHARAVHQKEAAEARAYYEMMRLELDAARRKMVEYHMAHTLDHEFHGSIDARLLTGWDAAALNARFVREGGSPPFHSEVPLYQVTVTSPIELCRTHRAADLSSLRAARSANGDWFVPCHTLEHLDRKHLRDLLALPDTNAADYVARYTVPAGTKFYVGAAGPIRGETAGRVDRMYTDAEGRAVGGGGHGGKLQFFLDPHINAPEITGSDAAAKAALGERQSQLRRSIVYHDSTPVPDSRP